MLLFLEEAFLELLLLLLFLLLVLSEELFAFVVFVELFVLLEFMINYLLY